MKHFWIAVALAVTLTAAACGSDTATTDEGTGSGVTTTDEAPVDGDAPPVSEPIEIADQVTVTGDALPAFNAEGDDEAVGALAPTFSTIGPNNALVEYAPGEPTILAFLVHWCPHCQTELPVISQSITSGATAGVEVIAVSTAFDVDRGNWPPSSWFEAEGWPAQVAVDSATSEIATAYGMTSFPYLVAIDADGVVVGRRLGGGEAPVAELVGLATGSVAAT